MIARKCLGLCRHSAPSGRGKLCARTYSTSAKRHPVHPEHLCESVWSRVPKGPMDPILGVTVKFLADSAPNKLNLGVGTYRDENGHSYVLPCVREAEARLHQQDIDHEYTCIGGAERFNNLAASLAFGETSPLILNRQIATVQTLSGTGALHIGADFLKSWLPNLRYIHYSTPTWGNHIPICLGSQLEPKRYRYYDSVNIAIEEDNMLEDLNDAPSSSVIMLQVSAHNPTGIDPSRELWKKISEVCKTKKHLVFFDLAYQGFATGNTDNDAWPIRYFVEQGHLPLVSQSFAKNFGLYGQRVGALHVATANPTEAESVKSQLELIIRPQYSSPPIHGARIVSTILGDPVLKNMWKKDVRHMADQIKNIRQLFVSQLKQAGSTRDWSHITKQIGMFCYTGLKEEECRDLAELYHIYMTLDGRASIPGISKNTVGYLADSIAKVTHYQ
ncbi:aspartate aminotransferase, mitochondrial-like [Schistocerca gregaria]|uniref:aspartate aminotransferase, mitochondrial-like n=1 Tax=Schistocerca gregaria TaxID=7010 RepID=UPI00211DBCFC|nr:aspartate aminotransferase, mitochondrial-like [Schistocerca gregaria]